MDVVEWAGVEARLAAGLRCGVQYTETLRAAGAARAAWAARADGLGEVVVKARKGDRAREKTQWRVANLPLLAARGYPAPDVVWHGALDEDWYLVVEVRLPGRPPRRADAALVAALIELVELQAEARVDPRERVFAAYQANVLFDGWDHVWRDAESASAEAAELCSRLRGWLRPVWGHRLPARDFAHNDLNLSNVLADGAAITGVVDWDEFGLNSRAADLTTLAFDCERRAPGPSAGEALCGALLERVRSLAGDAGARCLVSYHVIAHTAALVRRGESERLPASIALAQRVLDRLAA